MSEPKAEAIFTLERHSLVAIHIFSLIAGVICSVAYLVIHELTLFHSSGMLLILCDFLRPYELMIAIVLGYLIVIAGIFRGKPRLTSLTFVTVFVGFFVIPFFAFAATIFLYFFFGFYDDLL